MSLSGRSTPAGGSHPPVDPAEMMRKLQELEESKAKNKEPVVKIIGKWDLSPTQHKIAMIVGVAIAVIGLLVLISPWFSLIGVSVPMPYALYIGGALIATGIIISLFFLFGGSKTTPNAYVSKGLIYDLLNDSAKFLENKANPKLQSYIDEGKPERVFANKLKQAWFSLSPKMRVATLIISALGFVLLPFIALPIAVGVSIGFTFDLTREVVYDLAVKTHAFLERTIPKIREHLDQKDQEYIETNKILVIKDWGKEQRKDPASVPAGKAPSNAISRQEVFIQEDVEAQKGYLQRYQTRGRYNLPGMERRPTTCPLLKYKGGDLSAEPLVFGVKEGKDRRTLAIGNPFLSVEVQHECVANLPQDIQDAVADCDEVEMRLMVSEDPGKVDSDGEKKARALNYLPWIFRGVESLKGGKTVQIQAGIYSPEGVFDATNSKNQVGYNELTKQEVGVSRRKDPKSDEVKYALNTYSCQFTRNAKQSFASFFSVAKMEEKIPDPAGADGATKNYKRAIITYTILLDPEDKDKKDAKPCDADIMRAALGTGNVMGFFGYLYGAVNDARGPRPEGDPLRNTMINLGNFLSVFDAPPPPPPTDLPPPIDDDGDDGDGGDIPPYLDDDEQPPPTPPPGGFPPPLPDDGTIIPPPPPDDRDVIPPPPDKLD